MSSLSALSVSSFGLVLSPVNCRDSSLHLRPSQPLFTRFSPSLSRSPDLCSLLLSRLPLPPPSKPRLTSLALYLLSLSPFVRTLFFLAPFLLFTLNHPSRLSLYVCLSSLRLPLEPFHPSSRATPVFVYLMPFHSLLVSRASTFSD